MRRWLVAAALAASVSPASAQVNGHVSAMVDVLPDVAEEEGAQSVGELRARVFVERRQDLGQYFRLHLSGYVDGLIAGRRRPDGVVRDAIARPGDLYVEYVRPAFDVRAGASRLVWGRLDEFQPADVVNPIDLTRFLLEGRTEARLPVAMVRGRIFMPRSSTLEAVVVPVFRASRFDQLDEETSPFDITSEIALPRRRSEPATQWRNLQGGARFTSTAGRVDWGATAYRGFRTFPILTGEPVGFATPELLETFPRFTMLGGDFETVRGAWGVRGEVAAFVRDEIQSSIVPRGVPGRSIEAGIGGDRRAGDYRIAANVLWSWRSVDESEHDLSLVVAADRSFGRETRTLRVFAVYDPADATTFGRIVAAVSVRENVWVEGSAGLFTGSSSDILGRLTRRDFVYTRLKVYF